MINKRDSNLSEMLDSVDMESVFDREGISYHSSRGSSGYQLSVKTCPFCGNEKWKYYMNAESGAGKCFVCEQKANKFSFIKALLNLDNSETFKYLKVIASESGWKQRRVFQIAVNINTLRLPESIALPYKGRNLKYLDNRNITSDVAKYFHLRYCHIGEFSYISDGNLVSQDYSNRVIIPIFDLMGDMTSFQGRDVTGNALRKYLFPPGFAATGSTLYNGHNAIKAKSVVIGEGTFDAISLKIAFDEISETRNLVSIATFGKHLSFGNENSQLSQLLKLKEGGLESVCFMWDSEPKALLAAIDSALMCKSVGLRSKVAILPKGLDPNEAAPEDVRKAFWRAKEITPTTAAIMKLEVLNM